MAPFDTPLRRLRDTALDLLFPPLCVVCRRVGRHLCDACAAEITPAAGPRCGRCWTVGDAPLCATCEDAPPGFDSRRAAFVFEGKLRDAVLALKYEGMSSVAGPLIAHVALETVAPAEMEPRLVTAVPMRGMRRRRRGFNQAEVLGRSLAERLALPFDGAALQRVGRPGPQARQPDLAARRANVRDAFRGDGDRVRGRSILIVDDVTTSGATLDACARAARDAGAASVATWALAIED